MVESRALSHPSPQYADASLLRVGSDWSPLLNTPGLHSDEMAFVAVTPDHIDVFSLRSTPHCALHAALRLLLLLFNCSHTNLVHSFFFFFFFIIYFSLFYYILLYLNIYLLNEEEDGRENTSGASGFRTPNLPIMWPALCPLRHGGTPDTRRLTSEGSDNESRQFDETNKITLNITTRCHHCTLRVTLDTTIDVSPNLALFADHIHSTPRTLRRPSPLYTSHSFTDPPPAHFESM